MNRSIALVLSTAALLLHNNPAECGFIYSGHTYELTSFASSWTQAEAEAVARGGHLVAINTPEEQSFLNQTFLSGTDQDRILWTGLTDRAVEGVFGWSNGDPLGYTNWRAFEPNNLTTTPTGFMPEGEDYVVLNWGYARDGHAVSQYGRWNDVPNVGSLGYGDFTDGPYFGIIELPTDASTIATPAPAGLDLLGAGALGLCGYSLLRRTACLRSIVA
jgi:hypothetical protein